jgi:hypothetical protein
MPVTDVIDVDDTPDGVTEHATKVYAAIVEHAADLRLVKAWRARTAKERRRSLAPSKGWMLEPADDRDEMARRTANAIMDVIATDAAGDPWRGEVELTGEPDAKGRPTVLASVEIKLTGGAPQPKATKDDEMVGVLAACRETIKTLGELVVRIGSTKADELQAYASMVIGVTETIRKLGAAQGKWDFRMHRETQETERVVEAERARAAKSRAFWDAFETFATEWKDVGMVWSKWITEQGKKGSGAQQSSDAPTADECARVFGALEFCERQITIDIGGNRSTSTIRATVAEMTAEPDAKARMALARRLGAMVNALSQAERDQMTKHTVEVLKVERAQQVVRWLSAPFAFEGAAS